MPAGTKGHAFGTYMHAGYWTNHTVHDPYPEKIDSVMSFMLKKYDARSYLEVNGQTFRPFLLNLAAFGNWAYDPERYHGERFYGSWCSYYFGKAASPFAVASMKALHAAQFNRSGYVQSLGKIRNMIGFLQDRPAVSNSGQSYRVAYSATQLPDLQKRLQYVNAALQYAASGMDADDQVGFYYDYVYLPALMYKQLLDLETALSGAALYKHKYATGHLEQDILTARQLADQASRQLDAIYSTCLRGDKNPAWKTWYDPGKRRPNNGFPTPEAMNIVRKNLAAL
jgi:hypothetical protein